MIYPADGRQLPLFAAVGVRDPNSPAFFCACRIKQSTIRCPIQAPIAVLWAKRAESNLSCFAQIADWRDPNVRLTLHLNSQQRAAVRRQTNRGAVNGQIRLQPPSLSPGIRNTPQLLKAGILVPGGDYEEVSVLLPLD